MHSISIAVFKKKKIRLAWYECILSFIAFLLFVLMVQTFIASLMEGHPRAAFMSVVFIGVPIVVITAGVYNLITSRLKKR